MFRELQRKNKQISMEECIELLKKEKRGVLSVLGDDDYPYGMPMNHWYNEEDGKIYFHCGKSGHRLDALRKCNKVSFCTYDRGYREDGDWAFHVKSVIVFGTIAIVEDMETPLQEFSSAFQFLPYTDSDASPLPRFHPVFSYGKKRLTGRSHL